MLKASFADKEILLAQVEGSFVTPIYEDGLISIKFTECEGDKYPHSVRVPVEMRAFQNDKAPIVFMLHVIGGYLNELEIFSADGAAISAGDIALDNLEYVIDPMVMLK